MTDRAQLLLRGRRVGVALLGAGAAAALVVGVLAVPGPTLRAEPRSAEITPVRATQSLVCGGPILGLSRGPDPQVIAVGEPARRSAGEGLVERAITTSDAVDGGAAIVELPAEAPADDVSATERQELDEPELRGLAVAECLPPSPTSWLVGGSTTTGRSSTIVLSNPGEVAATVDLAVWGADGPLDTTGTSGLIVPPGAQRVIPLSGIAPDEASPVVGVSSRGGAVAATLQQSTIIGLEPAGVDVVTPVAAPAERVVIPALPVVDSEGLAVAATALGAVDVSTVLRVLVPGDEPADVTVSLLPDAGGEGTALIARVEAGAVIDLALGELADGDYSVLIDATEPIVAAARASAASDAGLDSAWFTAAPALDDDDGDILLAIAPGSGARLHLVAPDGAAIVTVDGELVELGPRSRTSLELAGNTAPVMIVSGEVRASVSYLTDAGLASARILAPVAAPRPITVFP
ncbi:DUF5719 family protein [Yonghaparkia sp. Soil809]|uniref:DUF5719 family protein n=1 Tax=Yonghaparkia sp. Soil809 TaxID=1736417 RepID=UPI0006F9EEAA|nr:DUF5719 family protein [Yonghaparkia sp. Soil809]KRF33745.1 hypothetical protein ASG83_07580 [Yonghaparkia sp. Soil809]